MCGHKSGRVPIDRDLPVITFAHAGGVLILRRTAIDREDVAGLRQETKMILKHHFRICGLLLISIIGRHAGGVRTPEKQKPARKQQTLDQRIAQFETQVEELRQQLRIPGMSAVMLKDQKVVWIKGLVLPIRKTSAGDTGHALSHRFAHQDFCATLIMQLVEQGKLDLNEPMSHYSSDFTDDLVRIKHLLSHTSQGTPGERYQYSGNRYNYLPQSSRKSTASLFAN